MAEEKETVEVDNRPTSQIDLERRAAEGFLPESARLDHTKDDALDPGKVNAPYATEDMDTSAYRGVSPEYMQYANPSERPYEATEGPEAEALKRLSGGVPGVFKYEEPASTPGGAVGGQRLESLNTAVSGENYSSELVDRPEPQVQANGVGLDQGQVKSNDSSSGSDSSAPAPPPAPADDSSSATPAKSTRPAAKPTSSK